MNDQRTVADSIVRPVRRIQLFVPPMVISRYQARQCAMFPLGLGYIAAVLEGAGYEVELVDCPTEGYDTTVDAGKGRVVYGLSEGEIKRRIEAFRPDAVGISCIFSSLGDRLKRVARLAKEVDPEIVVFAGGPHVSAFWRSLVRSSDFDYLVAGEGEQIAVDLMAALDRGAGFDTIGSLVYRRDGRVVMQPRRGWIDDLDGLPHPAWHLTDVERYFRIGKTQGLRIDGEQRLMQVTTSRGCPCRCSFCAKDVTWGAGFRARGVESVIGELTALRARYGVRRFAIQDDNFTADMERAEAICDAIVERRLDITWEAHNGLGVSYLSPRLLERMKASGCVGFTIAVESSSPTTLKRARKPNYIETAAPIVDEARRLGLDVRGFFMIGFPGETLEEVQQTIEYARSLDLSVAAFALVTPLPGTALFDQCVASGVIPDPERVDLEALSFGGLELQLSEVPVEKLKAIRKIEWLKTAFMDREGNLKTDLQLPAADVVEELQNGLRLFPEEPTILKLEAQARLELQARG